MFRYSPKCSCCVACNDSAWPSTLYLDTGLTTYTLTQSGATWSSPLFQITQGGYDSSANPTSTIPARIGVSCQPLVVGGPVRVIVKLAFSYWGTGGIGAGHTNPCTYYGGTGGFPSSLLSFGTVAAFTNSPVSGSGTWDLTPNPSCPSITNPFAGMSWTLRQ